MSALMWLGAALACLSAALAVWTVTSSAGLSLVRGLFGRLRVRIEGLGRGGVASKGPPGVTGPLGKLLSGLGKAIRFDMRRGGEARARAGDRSRCLDELPELIDVVALGMSAAFRSTPPWASIATSTTRCWQTSCLMRCGHGS